MKTKVYSTYQDKLVEHALIRIENDRVIWINTNIKTSGVRKDGEMPGNVLESFEIKKMHSSEILKYKSEVTHQIVSKTLTRDNYFIKLNPIQLFSITWEKKEFLIQDRQLKIGLLKYFIGGVIGFIFGLIPYCSTHKMISSTTESQNIRKEVLKQKISPNDSLQSTPVKNDTLLID